MARKAYITILGRSTWALLNAYYSVVDSGYHPSRVHIIVEENFLPQLENAHKGIEIIGEGFSLSQTIESHTVAEADFINAGMEIFSLIKKLEADGFEIAIDITPGRKALVTAALIPAMKSASPISHIFYLAIKTVKNASRPYYMIPFAIQDLQDIVTKARSIQTKHV